MNYIKEMNAFYNQIEINPLSSSAVALWHTLMHINNKTGWKQTFTVATGVLRIKAGLKDSAFKRARIELQEKGYISFQSRGGNQAAQYEMHSLLYTCQSNELEEKPQETNPAKKQHSTESEALTFYIENFGDVRPYITEEVLEWIANSGEALVKEAMKNALDKNKNNWGYVKGILQSWSKKGITNVEETKQEKSTFTKQTKQKKAQTYTAKIEEVPGWYRNLKKQPIPEKPVSEEEGQVDVSLMLQNYKKQKELGRMTAQSQAIV
ncbi:DnaD domain-containing protein [Paraliobacillus sediminis]|uniref:DnaD domain-containing protein n=1 Tax=Paraliobacillus sediminis TaxID=1885916 RepID=UPI000E3D8F30|nr:DnaD domain protein [Paraliobacillus sediminis]